MGGTAAPATGGTASRGAWRGAAKGASPTLTGADPVRILPRMSTGLVVELERLAAEAALSRAQLEELGDLVSSYRQRIGEGVAALQQSAPAAHAHASVEQPTAPPVSASPDAAPGSDPTPAAGAG